MWISFKNWLIKLAVAGLVKASKFEKVEEIIKGIIAEIAAKNNIKIPAKKVETKKETVCVEDKCKTKK